MGFVDSVTISLRKADVRPWAEKWIFVLHQLERLRAVYDGTDRPRGTLDIEGLAMSFFVECDHLEDWMKRDPAPLPGLTGKQRREFRKAVVAFHDSDVALRQCSNICNAHKHYGRDDGLLVARIRTISELPPGWRVTIDLDWPKPTSPTVDALELADQCVAAWKGFFAANGIHEPT